MFFNISGKIRKNKVIHINLLKYNWKYLLDWRLGATQLKYDLVWVSEIYNLTWGFEFHISSDRLVHWFELKKDYKTLLLSGSKTPYFYQGVGNHVPWYFGPKTAKFSLIFKISSANFHIGSPVLIITGCGHTHAHMHA